MTKNNHTVKPSAAAKPHAPPPLHSVATIVVMLSSCAYLFPSMDAIDEVATIDTFTRPVFPGSALSSLEAMGRIRLVFSAVIFFVTCRFMMMGTEITTTYLPGTKLRVHVLRLKGLRTQGFYTGWSWNLLGLSFFLSGSIPLLVNRGHEQHIEDNPWILRAALLSFEIAAPNAFLVSTIVRYALWPTNLKAGGPARTAGFKRFTSMMQHNANVIMVLMEVCLVGGLPVLLSHIAVAPIYGVIYVLFSWFMSNRWSPRNGPTFLYFLLDTTLEMKSTFMIVILLVVLLVFYFFFSTVEDLLEMIDGGPLTHLLCVVVLSSIVCRFRD